MQILPEEIRLRQKKVREQMSKSGMDVLVIGASAQMDSRGTLRYLMNYYLPVFEEYMVIPISGDVVFFAHDASGAEYAAQFGVVDDIRIIPNHEYNADPGKSVADFIKSLNPKAIGITGLSGLSAHFYLSLLRNLEDQSLIDFTSQLNRIKMVKSTTEILLSEAAIRLNEETFYHYLQHIKPGKLELDAVNAASSFAMQAGAEDLYWMVASGEIPRLGYLADARQNRHVWRKNDYHYVILEHSAEGGYFGETTHLISLGDPKPEYQKAFAVIGEAQRAAAAVIKTGATLNDLAYAAEQVLADYGYAKPHKTGLPFAAIGHSQGVDVWEFPRIVQEDETLIEPGMRFNIHPAIVLPDKAVLTSCDCYISTETGARRLSTLPYEIIVV